MLFRSGRLPGSGLRPLPAALDPLHPALPDHAQYPRPVRRRAAGRHPGRIGVQILQVSYIAFQINVASYNAIYGSFAALPLFLIWLQLSWHIVLFGAEIAHFFPQSDTVAAEPKWRERSTAQTRLLALAVCHEIVQRFHRDEPSVNEAIIASEFDMSRSEASEIIDELVHAHLLHRVQPEGDETPQLQPARRSEERRVGKECRSRWSPYH